jgi:hypothetical protein
MKQVPESNKGLAKLPKQVRNKMGYMNKGGMSMKFEPCAGCPSPAKCAKEGCQKKKNKMAYGGMAKKKPAMAKGGMMKNGYNKGGYCGASNPAERPMKKGK